MKAPLLLPQATARRRAVSAGAVLLLILCGLLWRRLEFGLPPPAVKYGGSIIWGMMVFFCVAALLPRRGGAFVALAAAVVAALVEASQLIHIEPLDQFRRTTIGALLLGRTFSWWDIASYWTGITVTWLAVSMAALRWGRTE